MTDRLMRKAANDNPAAKRIARVTYNLLRLCGAYSAVAVLGFLILDAANYLGVLR